MRHGDKNFMNCKWKMERMKTTTRRKTDKTISIQIDLETLLLLR
jgi:hypothetical protein